MDRILLVDEKDMVRPVFKQVFTGLPVEVDTTRSFNKALKLLQNKSYSLVIADLLATGNMTIPEGFEVIRQAKRMQNSCKVVVTGSGVDGISEKALGLGADFYLERPFSPLKVKEMLQSAGMVFA
jgi:CheY-like chemotaxis protein